MKTNLFGLIQKFFINSHGVRYKSKNITCTNEAKFISKETKEDSSISGRWFHADQVVQLVELVHCVFMDQIDNLKKKKMNR